MSAGVVALGGTQFLQLRPAGAAVPTILPISGSKTQFFKNKEFRQKNHRMQSFAFDSRNRKLFVATLRDDHDNNDGDLEIARVLVGAGSEGALSSQYMNVSGAGHAVAFGVEPVGDETYIWMEYKSNSNGYGTRVGRFRFIPGRDVKASHEAATAPYFGDRYILATGSENVTCSVDHVFNYGDGKARLAVRRNTPGVSGTTRVEVYRLNGTASAPVLEYAQKPRSYKLDGSSSSETWQGWAFYGNNIYTITGDHGQDNTYLWRDTITQTDSTDWETGPVMSRPVAPVKQSIPGGIVDAEPEGVAVYKPSSADDVRLNFGLTSGGTPRLNGIYYREA